MMAVMENQKLNLKLMKVNMTIADIMVKKWTTKQDFFARQKKRSKGLNKRKTKSSAGLNYLKVSTK